MTSVGSGLGEGGQAAQLAAEAGNGLRQASQIPHQAPRSGPYASSEEHLWDELSRIDYLVRAETLRWLLTIAQGRPPHLWGMTHVSEEEIAAFLDAPFLAPFQEPEDLANHLGRWRSAAERSADAIRARRAQTPPDLTLRLVRLQRLFDLSDLERDIVLVCLLAETDVRYRRLFGYLQDDASRTMPTVELALQILRPVAASADGGRSAFEGRAPLLVHHLASLCREGQGEGPLSTHSIRLEEVVVGYLLGRNLLDRVLTDVVSETSGQAEEARLSNDDGQATKLHALIEWWTRIRGETPGGATLFLYGSYGSGRLPTARAICAATRTPLFIADVERSIGAQNWEQTVTLTYRDAALRGAAVYWSGCETLLEDGQPTGQWRYLMEAAERFRGLTFVASHTAWDAAGVFHATPFIRLDFPMPGYEARRRLWERQLPPPGVFAPPPPDRASLSELLAQSFQLTQGQVIDVLSTARAQAVHRDPNRPLLTVADLYEGCRRQSGRHLMKFARRIEPPADLGLEDLILPAASKRQIYELQGRVRDHSRVSGELGFERRLTLGKGLVALFTGSSGTGKTMAAEILALQQGVDLYKVDLSAVVSKYVGETEKHLNQVFTEAEDANAILFFDEADALFGKRGEVRQAQDRWANLEVNYLLQRVEEYSGVVILASNLRQNIDEAFLRRIQVIVEFPFPDADARLAILAGMFPAEVRHPSDDDLRRLAKPFRLPGGCLKNLVLDAAYRSLADVTQTPTITLRHLVAATAREYQKLGKPITKGEFGEAFYSWVEADIL